MTRSFEICNSVCPLCRECGRHKIHFPAHRVLEHKVFSFMPKTGKCLSRIDITKEEEEVLKR